ncbi:MAG: hypothetical protein ACRDBP_05080 [Luteolibacter sp.]
MKSRQPAERQMSRFGFIPAAVSLISILSVACDKDESLSEWWQGEQDRIALVHQVELKQYRLAHGDFGAYEEVKRLRALVSEQSERLTTLGAQRQVLQEQVATVEREGIIFRETAIRNQRERALGKTFQSIQSTSGRIYQKVSVAAIDDSGVTIRHSDGSARLRFADLDADQQVFFGLEAGLASVAEEKEAIAQVVYEREMDEQLAALQLQKKENADRLASEESAAKRSRTLLASRAAEPSSTSRLSSAATPFGRRLGSYSSDRTYRYRSSSGYRSNYYYVVPSSPRYCPSNSSSGSSGAMYIAPSAASSCPKFANTTLPYIP